MHVYEKISKPVNPPLYMAEEVVDIADIIAKATLESHVTINLTQKPISLIEEVTEVPKMRVTFKVLKKPIELLYYQ